MDAWLRAPRQKCTITCTCHGKMTPDDLTACWQYICLTEVKGHGYDFGEFFFPVNVYNAIERHF